jgi:hypothetical protein
MSVRQRRKQHSCVEIPSQSHLCAVQYYRTRSAASSCTPLIENFPIYEAFMRVSQLSHVTARIADQRQATYVALQEHRTRHKRSILRSLRQRSDNYDNRNDRDFRPASEGKE